MLQDQKNMRPVDIEADVKEMERRKRVEAIMSSKLFREELERVVGDSLRDSGADSIAGLISDVMNIKTGSKCFLFSIKTLNLIAWTFIEYFREHSYVNFWDISTSICHPVWFISLISACERMKLMSTLSYIVLQ